MNRYNLILVLTLVILLGLLGAAAAGAFGPLGPSRGYPGDVRLYLVEGQKVPCIVAHDGASGSLAMSCDWHRTENLP